MIVFLVDVFLQEGALVPAIGDGAAMELATAAVVSSDIDSDDRMDGLEAPSFLLQMESLVGSSWNT